MSARPSDAIALWSQITLPTGSLVIDVFGYTLLPPMHHPANATSFNNKNGLLIRMQACSSSFSLLRAPTTLSWQTLLLQDLAPRRPRKRNSYQTEMTSNIVENWTGLNASWAGIMFKCK